MNYPETLRDVFSRSRYRHAFLIMILALGALLAVTADILVVPGLYVNPGVEPLQLGIVALLVLVMALNGTVALHNIDGRTVAGSAGGLFGTAGALFTSACPFCQPIWLVWLGFGSATAFLAQYGALIGIGSIALLGISLHYGLKSASGTCEVKLSVLKPSRVSDRSKSGGFFHGKNA